MNYLDYKEHWAAPELEQNDEILAPITKRAEACRQHAVNLSRKGVEDWISQQLSIPDLDGLTGDEAREIGLQILQAADAIPALIVDIKRNGYLMSADNWAYFEQAIKSDESIRDHWLKIKFMFEKLCDATQIHDPRRGRCNYRGCSDCT